MRDQDKTKAQLMGELAQLRQQLAECETLQTERKRAEERIEHLSLVLRAIRSVNQLIAMERDRDRLLEGVCNRLIETRGYYTAWIVLLDEFRGFVTSAEAGFAEDFPPMTERLRGRALPECGQRALIQADIAVTEDPVSTCTDCPLAHMCVGGGAMTIRLEHDEKVYGLLSVCVPTRVAADKEERDLFKEVAIDVAFALRSIELEEERKRAEEELKASEEKYRAFIEDINEGFMVVRGSKVLFANRSAAEAIGRPVEDIIGGPFLEDLAPGSLEKSKQIYEKTKAGEPPPDHEDFELQREDGTPVFVAVRFKKTIYEGERAYSLLIMDITERKRAEEALRESEEKFSKAFRASPCPVMITTLTDGRLVDVNDSFIHVTGYDYEEIVGLTMDELQLWVQPHEHAAVVQVLQDKGQVRDTEVEFRMKSGETRTGLTSVETVYIGDELCGLYVVNDITERREAEEKIRAFQSRLRSLASRLSLAEERERRRLAATVHDQISQQLAVLQMKLGAMREPLSSTGLQEQMDEIRELVGHTIQNTRSLTFELSPPILYELGLEPALEWLVEQVQAEHGVAGRFEDDGQNKPLGDDARGFIFWVVRELLMNVIKHARAQSVKVSVCRDNGELRVVVEDNGVGFDTSEMERRTRGFGLFSIRERLTEFGGQFEVESEPGRGTRVTLVAPLESGGESTGGN